MQSDTKYMNMEEEKRRLADKPIVGGYRPNPIDGPSGIPKCCSQDVVPMGSAPFTVVAPFVVEPNIGN